MIGLNSDYFTTSPKLKAKAYFWEDQTKPH
jgi:hypothetical protein